MKLIYSTFALTLILPLSQAEEALPSDVQRVSDQRDAAIDKINKTYVQELERLKTSYTKQGNLDVANKIVKLISGIKSDDLIGKWVFSHNGFVAEIKTGGDAILDGKIRGKWAAKDSNLTIKWDHGYIDSFGLPPVDEVMSGKNQQGFPLRLTRAK
jgi:hypothetical protein